MFKLFKIRKDERWLALGALLLFALLNALLIYRYYDRFTLGGNLGFWTIFYKNFHVSGFDAYSYITMSNLRVHFTTARHPLYLSLLLPFYWLNHWQMQYTHYNMAVYFEAFIIVFSSVYAFLFLYRTLHELISLKRQDAVMLTVYFFSFGHVLLSTMVPDHFAISMFLLMATVYVAGRKMKDGTLLRPLQVAVLLFFTAGITVTNGVKTLLAVLFTNVWRTLLPFGGRQGKTTGGRAPLRKWGSMLLAVVVPVALLWGIWQWQYQTIEVPQAIAVKKQEAIQKRKDPNFEAKHKVHDDFVRRQNGAPVTKDVPVLRWSDVTTDRMQSVVDNLFGETFILHRNHLLEDVQQERPVFVDYDSPVHYVAEVLIVVLLILGLWAGCFPLFSPEGNRRDASRRLMWMLFSWFAFDMLMHIGFGFGINEVYIMAAHWAFIVPIATGCLLRRLDGALAEGLRWCIAILTVWLLFYNGSLIASYLLKG